MRNLDRRRARPHDRGIEVRRRIGGEIFMLEAEHCDENAGRQLICISHRGGWLTKNWNGLLDFFFFLFFEQDGTSAIGSEHP